MANNKDFKVKNGIQPTAYHEGLGTVTSGSEGYGLTAAFYTGTRADINVSTVCEGITFKPDGTKIFIAEISSDSIYQYPLSTAWDITTLGASSGFSVATEDSQPRGVEFNSNGTKMYVVGTAGNDINQYSLSTAWDVTTASFDSVTFSVASQGTIPRAIKFKPDGTKMYIADSDTDGVFQYSLSTAYDLSTASYDSVSLDVSSQEATVSGLDISGDGTQLFIVGGVSDSIHKYNLSTAYDLSTATYSNESFSFSSETATPLDIFFFDDGDSLFMLAGDDFVYQYSTVLTTATLDLSTGSVFEITPTSDIQIGLSNPADSGTVSQATLLLDRSITAGSDLFFFAADAGNNSNYDAATGWTSILDLGNQSTPDTNFYLVRQTAATDGSYSISFATNNSNAVPSGGAFMCTNGATYQGVSNGTGTVSFASGLTVGESVLFLVESGDNSNTTYTPPSGYTVLFESTGTETTLTHTVVSYKIADATSESTSGGTFSSGSAYRALVHVQNSGTDATDGDIASEVQKATAVVSTFTVSDGQLSYNNEVTITYDSTLQFGGGTAPDSPAIGETDVLTFSTRDGGTTYQAALSIDGAS